MGANDESAISSCLGLRHVALSAKLGTASLILPFALTWQNTDHALPMAAKVLAMIFFLLWGACRSANDESAISSCLGLRHAARSAKLGTASLILPFALTWQNTDHALPMAAKVLQLG